MAGGIFNPDDLKLPDTLQRRLTNLTYIRAAGSSVGLTAGLIYAFKTKKKFWGYAGFGLLGVLIIGGITYAATLPVAAGIQKDVNALQPEGQAK